jgi:hypothetical protein
MIQSFRLLPLRRYGRFVNRDKNGRIMRTDGGEACFAVAVSRQNAAVSLGLDAARMRRSAETPLRRFYSGL